MASEPELVLSFTSGVIEEVDEGESILRASMSMLSVLYSMHCCIVVLSSFLYRVRVGGMRRTRKSGDL